MSSVKKKGVITLEPIPKIAMRYIMRAARTVKFARSAPSNLTYPPFLGPRIAEKFRSLAASRNLGRKAKWTMKALQFSEAQIGYVLRQAEGGTAVAEVYRSAGIPEVRRLKVVENKNAKLKKLLAEAILDHAMLNVNRHRGMTPRRNRCKHLIYKRMPTPERQ